jgi:hypothetical protein
VELLAITGDVFDSGTLEPERAVNAFLELYERLINALGRPVPSVIVPGNHDRRLYGMFGPHRTALFERLARDFAGRGWVHGAGAHFLAGVVPEALHPLPAWILTYDSTYLPLGLLSAGGALREEDLLHAAAQIEGKHPEWPLVFMLHHHLVPTPLTDVGPIEIDGLPQLLRWAVSKALPRLVSNADREELTMTALGAGSVLSVLHTLGRPVIVLHGHKHYANARHLGAIKQGQADVVILSAGSSGTAQSWFPTTARQAARLWPSFNVVELTPERLSADVVSFGYRADAIGETRVMPLFGATRRGARWEVAPVSPRPELESERRLNENSLRCRLSPSARERRWDVDYRRLYTGSSEAPESFEDTVDALEDSTISPTGPDAASVRLPPSPPCQMPLARDRELRYRIEGALCRHVSEAHRLFGKRWAPYCWLGLMNRYFSRRLLLKVDAGGAALSGAFASETDLGSGTIQPLALERLASDRVRVVYDNCPPRTLVRIHWPMEGQ